MGTINIEKAKLEPSHFFKTPDDVLTCKELKRDQKIEILKSWKHDALDMQVADEENMPCTDDRYDLLDHILKAMRDLGVTPNTTKGSPTKHGDI